MLCTVPTIALGVNMQKSTALVFDKVLRSNEGTTNKSFILYHLESEYNASGSMNLFRPSSAPPSAAAPTSPPVGPPARGDLEEDLKAINMIHSIFIATKPNILHPEGNRTSNITTSVLSLNLVMWVLSLHLYKVAYHLRKNAGRRNKTPEGDWKLSMFDLAILNNAGTLLVQILDRGTAQAYFEWLSSMLSQVNAPKVDLMDYYKTWWSYFPGE